MDDYERSTRIRTEEVAPTEPVYPADPVVPVVPTVPAVPAVPAARRVVRDDVYVATGPTPIELARRIVALAFGILQALLIIRIILLLLVANRDNDIVRFILGVTDPFVNPFRDMFALNQVGAGGSVLDVAAIVALIAWTLVEMLIFAILNLGSRSRRTVVD